MKKLLVIALLAFPWSASAAGHLDAIQGKLTKGCTVEKYVAIVADFNEQWGSKHGYKAEVAVPLQSQDLVSIFWIGRSANAAAFGNAWDRWRDAQMDSKSVAAKLQKRFDACVVNESRSSFDVY